MNELRRLVSYSELEAVVDRKHIQLAGMFDPNPA